MADKFEKWDRFYKHYKETGNATKAKRWVAYEDWAAKRWGWHRASAEKMRIEALKAQADKLAEESLKKVDEAKNG
jgi:hypothetical protein